MIDHANELRRAIIAKLKADLTVAGIVGTRVKDAVEQNPTWPFIRYGLPVSRPYGTSCGDGSEHDVTLHAFARGPGTDSITALTRAIVACLDDADLTVTGVAKNYGVDWIDTRVMPDGDEPNDHHGVIRFSATLL